METRTGFGNSSRERQNFFFWLLTRETHRPRENRIWWCELQSVVEITQWLRSVNCQRGQHGRWCNRGRMKSLSWSGTLHSNVCSYDLAAISCLIMSIMLSPHTSRRSFHLSRGILSSCSFLLHTLLPDTPISPLCSLGSHMVGFIPPGALTLLLYVFVGARTFSPANLLQFWFYLQTCQNIFYGAQFFFLEHQSASMSASGFCLPAFSLLLDLQGGL